MYVCQTLHNNGYEQSFRHYPWHKFTQTMTDAQASNDDDENEFQESTEYKQRTQANYWLFTFPLSLVFEPFAISLSLYWS